MDITLSKKELFPEEVEALLAAIDSSGFFLHGLIGEVGLFLSIVRFSISNML